MFNNDMDTTPDKGRADYIYIWEYVVREDCADEFRRVYGPEGDWLRLFRRAEGFLGTELHADINDDTRFMTIDSWVSKAAHDAFRGRFDEEFRTLDEQCEKLTISETYAGAFSPVD